TPAAAPPRTPAARPAMAAGPTPTRTGRDRPAPLLTPAPKIRQPLASVRRNAGAGASCDEGPRGGTRLATHARMSNRGKRRAQSITLAALAAASGCGSGNGMPMEDGLRARSDETLFLDGGQPAGT